MFHKYRMYLFHTRKRISRGQSPHFTVISQPRKARFALILYGCIDSLSARSSRFIRAPSTLYFFNMKCVAVESTLS